jgi:hypothetical protein
MPHLIGSPACVLRPTQLRIRAKECGTTTKLLTVFLRKAEKGVIGKLIVEAVILLAASKQDDGGKTLRASLKSVPAGRKTYSVLLFIMALR